MSNISNDIETIDELLSKGRHIGGIPPEDIFWGNCSILQVWSENFYNTNLLTKELAFPLLKKLTEVGDPMSKKVFKDEIFKHFTSSHLTAVLFLIKENYLNIFKEIEKTTLFEELESQLSDPSSDVNASGWNKFGNAYEELGEIDRAIDSYKKALEINSEFKKAVINLKKLKKQLN